VVVRETFIESRDDQINAFVSSQVDYYLNRILGVIQPRAVVLYGSFGKGEGTVICDSNDIDVLSDFEIGVVSGDVTKLPALRRLGRDLQRDGPAVTLSFFLPRRFRTRVASNWTPPSRHLTLEQYELIAGLRVLNGKDPRPRGAVLSSSSIMRWDGLRTIFNRVADLLASLIALPVNPNQVWMSASKLLISCGDARLMVAKAYHHSYRERSVRLQSLVFTSSLENGPHQANWKSIADAYEWKLNPSQVGSLSIELEAIVEGVLLPVLRFYTDTVYGWTFQTAGEFRERYLNSSMLKNFSRSFIGYPLFQSVLISAKRGVATNIWSFAPGLWKTVHQTYANLVYELVTICGRHELSVQPHMALTPELRAEERLKTTSLLLAWRDLCLVL